MVVKHMEVRLTSSQDQTRITTKLKNNQKKKKKEQPTWITNWRLTEYIVMTKDLWTETYWHW